MNQQKIKHIAKLAGLDFNDDELEKFAAQFDEIVEHISAIDKFELDDLEPLVNFYDNEKPLREDSQRESLSHDEALKNAPETKDNHFVKPGDKS